MTPHWRPTSTWEPRSQLWQEVELELQRVPAWLQQALEIPRCTARFPWPDFNQHRCFALLASNNAGRARLHGTVEGYRPTLATRSAFSAEGRATMVPPQMLQQHLNRNAATVGCAKPCPNNNKEREKSVRLAGWDFVGGVGPSGCSAAVPAAFRVQRCGHLHGVQTRTEASQGRAATAQCTGSET